MKINYNTKDFLSSLIFYLAILLFIIGFNFTDSPPPFGWYQQFMPNIGNRTISDITFLDSLTGYAIGNSTSDTNYVLKTTNGGDNWQIVYKRYLAFEKMQFLDLNTGYMCGAYLWKTTDGGFNWNQVSAPPISPEGLYVINQDTIWIISSNSLTGGVFHTTDGGVSWTQQLALGSANPTYIYMFNASIGFIAPSTNNGTQYTRRTTNGGNTWDTVDIHGFTDIYFVDNLTGWKSGIKKTTNGGLNWIQQILPYYGGESFSNINKDTIWADGGYIFNPGQGSRAILNRTTDGGDTWYYQIPDTSFQIPVLHFINFVNKFQGWSYMASNRGIHTTTGGDSIFYLSIKQINWKVPNQFVLNQNYPNPFNISTKFKVQISKLADVKVVVFDVTGRLITTIINQKLNVGSYELGFDGSNYSSGVYFYQLQITDEKGGVVYTETKKMILIK